MTYHRKTVVGLSALALAVSAVYAAPTGPIGRIHEETAGEVSGPFFNAALFTQVLGECDGVCDLLAVPPVCTAGKVGDACTADAECNWKCIAGRVGDACSTDQDCNIYDNIIQTGFEAADGWDLGHSICGDEFALGLTCNYPVSNVCITKNHAASQNCCPEDPNVVNGWSMSPSSRHCLYPIVTDLNPSRLKESDPKFGGSTQHLRFKYDPAGGLPAGCNGFGPPCRQRYITSQEAVTQVSRSVWKKDIAWSGTLGSSIVEVHGQDTHAGSIDLTTYIYWHYYGGLYLYDFIDSAFVFGAYWSDTVPDYCQFVIDLNPCDNTVTYTYCGVVIHSEAYGFTPPYGDRAPGGPDPRPATTDTSFVTTDHFPPVTIDTDNFDVKNTPCGEACCDQTTGECVDVLKGECASKVVYPNTLCSQLGSPGYPPVCAIATGTCCDTSPMAGGPDAAGVCTNGVLESACSGAQRVWVKGGSCADVAGVCQFAHGECGGATGCQNYPNVGQKCETAEDCNSVGFCTAGRTGSLCLTDADCAIAASVCVEVPGACCETVKGTCEDGVYAGDCQGAQREWTKGALCVDVVCDPTLGACCDQDPFGGCTNTTFNGCPTNGTKNVWTKGILCEALDPPCTHDAIPTVSEWGLVVLTLLLLTGAKVYFGRRQAAAA